MLQAHSFLWNYLWVAPNVLLLLLGVVLALRGVSRNFPYFVTYALVSPCCGLALFAADVIPSVTGINFWRVDWVTLSIESILKFLAIAEVFSRVFNPFPSVSKVGRNLLRGVGALLVFGAASIAALSLGDSSVRIISGAHLLDLSVFTVECGLILFIFALSAYFRVPWDRVSFGVLFGFGISSCIHLALWAIMTNAAPNAQQRTIFDLLNMTTYHLTVLIWYYFFLVRGAKGRRHEDSPPLVDGSSKEPQRNLEDWNRELERLIHQ